MVRKTQKLTERIASILERLQQAYPDSKCSLDYDSPFQLLVATVLSAQCTDARVNKVTPELFRRYPDAAAMSQANLKDIESLIQSTGFFRMKAKSLLELSRDLVAKHEGGVPATLEELTALRGVGRKTANVVLGNAFGIPGVVVDTHVGRLARRMGFTTQLDPVKVEHDLMKLIPRDRWILFNHQLIDHGRKVCLARNPRCKGCPIEDFCPQVGVKTGV